MDKARSEISEIDAKELILTRWEKTLYAKVDDYLIQYSRQLRSALENLWEKYDQPLQSILKERDVAALELANYLKELGYD